MDVDDLWGNCAIRDQGGVALAVHAPQFDDAHDPLRRGLMAYV